MSIDVQDHLIASEYLQCISCDHGALGPRQCDGLSLSDTSLGILVRNLLSGLVGGYIVLDLMLGISIVEAISFRILRMHLGGSDFRGSAGAALLRIDRSREELLPQC